ncbi:Nn.00g113970.m01.CDS01 [Neocucurbitaria sp. VM-36]
MHSSLLASILFLLSILHLAAAAPEHVYPAGAAKLEKRQVSATPSQAELCADYQWTANMSTIGANGTYRTVLMQKSNVGTIYNARMMDAAIRKLPKLTADPILNMACGNWTEIAVREAAVNFTQGIVAQFTTEGLPVGIKAGPEVIVIVGVTCMIFSVVWVFSG